MLESSEEKIYFKPLSVDDLQRLHKWLISPHVNEWYDDGKQTFEDVEKKYLPRILGKEPISCFSILFEEKPIGQIQMYKINDYPEYKRTLQIKENAAGVDLFIGEKEFQHKGLGSIIIREFLEEFVFRQLPVESCIIGPHPINIIAIKAYQKAGFKHIKTIVNSKGEEEYLMRQPRSILKNKFNIT